MSPLVLLVEDSDADVELMRAAFAEALPGAEIRVAWDGEEALASLLDRERPPLPDLILLDLNLPRVGGLEVLQALRAADEPQVRRLPVVVLSTSDAPADVHRAYELGANAYVPKPFDVDDLLRVGRSLAEFWFRSAVLPRNV